MKESIYTIPVNEVFEEQAGCPFCAMRDRLEEQALDYILGAAMMEPDVRQETNRMGFCANHYDMMLPRRKKLSVALTAESRLQYVIDHFDEGLPAPTPLFGKPKAAPAPQQPGGDCFVCRRIELSMDKMLENTILMWKREPSFRELFARQPVLCYPHYRHITAKAAQSLDKKLAPVFIEMAHGITLSYLQSLKADVSKFCSMFDYRNAGAGGDWGNAKDAVERAIWFLTAHKPPQ